MFLWFPPSCGFHLPVVSTFPWFPILLWFLPSRSFHLPVVTPWFPPFRGFTLCGYSVDCTLLLFASLHGFHPPVVTRGVPSVVCTFRSLHSAMVSTVPWFSSLHGSHPPVVTPWCPFHGLRFCGLQLCCGFHPPVVCIFAWFPPSLWLLHGVPFVVCTITWFTLCRGFHPSCGLLRVSYPGFWLKLA